MKGRSRLCNSMVLVLALAAPASAGEPFQYPQARHGKGELKYISGLPVLMVEGTPEEIGEQIGVLATKPAPHLFTYLREFLKLQGWEAAYPVLVKSGNILLPQFPADHLKELEAGAKASGHPRDVFVFANTIADLKRVAGCSTLIVEGGKSATGKPLFGRNFDFPSCNMLHDYTLVTVYRPKGKHAFVSIGFPGLVGCISGMNDKGLALATDEIHSANDGSPRFDRSGTPMILTFRRILEECATVLEAEKLLRSVKRTTMISLTVCDPKGGVVFEITPKNVIVRRPEEGIGICTNHFRSQELATSTRCRRYEILADSRHLAKLAIADVAKNLHAANQGELTLQTMIFEPGSRQLHLAFGKGPSSAQPLKRLELQPLFNKDHVP